MQTLRRWSAILTLGIACGTVWASETPITVQGPAGALAGTLQTPDTALAHAPLVLIIPGSGPTDRDGNSPNGLRAGSYRLLAQDLAAQGIATARIDKRGLFGSAHAGVDANQVTIDDYAGDVEAWVRQLRKNTGTSCVWLLGHSEGALVAEVAAARTQGVCGLILVNGAGRSSADVLEEQLERNPANASLLPQAKTAIDALRKGQHVDVSPYPEPLQRLFRTNVQGFLISWFAQDPVQRLRDYKGPALVIQGTADLQITVDDAKRLAGARPGVRLKLVEGMNHVLKTPGEGMQANLASYGNADLPLADALVPAIAGFVHGR
nr:alpha/beta fold hydrolase [Dyella sp. ASV21]